MHHQNCALEKKEVQNSVSSFTDIDEFNAEIQRRHSGEDEFERREKLLEIYHCFSGHRSLFPMILNLSLLLFWDESVLYLFHAFANFVLFCFFSYYCHLHSCSPPSVGTSSLLLPFPQPHPFTVLRTRALLKMWKTLNL